MVYYVGAMGSLEKVRVVSWIRSNLKHRKVKKEYMPFLIECLFVLNAEAELSEQQLAELRKIKSESDEKRKAYDKRYREAKKAKEAAEDALAAGMKTTLVKTYDAGQIRYTSLTELAQAAENFYKKNGNNI
jgi:hypothetical protein